MLNPKTIGVFAIVIGAILLAGGRGLLAAAGGPTLSVTPDTVSSVPGMPVEVAFTLSAAGNAQGADIQFGFDPAVLQVVDADGGANGVQVMPGSCPAPEVVVINDVDNPGGTGRYAAASLGASCSNGPVFSAAFACQVEGASSIVIASAEISDPDGNTITVELFSGTVNCFPNAIYLPLIRMMP